MSNVIVPPPPYRTPFVSQEGLITPPWSKWLNQLFLRAGGSDAPSNSDFTSAVAAVTTMQVLVASLQSTVSTLSTSVTTLTNQVNGLSVGRQL